MQFAKKILLLLFMTPIYSTAMEDKKNNINAPIKTTNKLLISQRWTEFCLGLPMKTLPTALIIFPFSSVLWASTIVPALVLDACGVGNLLYKAKQKYTYFNTNKNKQDNAENSKK